MDPRNALSFALLERGGMRREAHFVESLRFKGAAADDVIHRMLRGEYMRNQGALFVAVDE